MKTRSFITICLAVAMVFAVSSVANATIVSLSGTLSGMDVDTGLNNGLGNYDCGINTGEIFSVSAGTVTISGTVDVSDLEPGSFLQVGLIDKEQTILAITGWLNGVNYFSPGYDAYMYNNSAILTFFENNTARLIDRVSRWTGSEYVYDPIQSDPIANPGSTPGEFSFTLEIDGAGTMQASLDGGSSWTSLNYGHRNWWDGDERWSGTELQNGAYLIAQMFVDTGVPGIMNLLYADYDITGVPEPTTIVLLGLGSIILLRQNCRSLFK